jgi:glycosyltransferase involved in cell wall biosynthesis
MMFQRNIVFISEKVKLEYLNSYYGKLLKGKKYYVLHNPIETDVRTSDEFLYEKLNLIKNKIIAYLKGDKNVSIVLVIACRLVEGKGIMEFLKSSVSKLRDVRLQLKIYGSGSLEDSLADYINREFPKGNVRLMGFERDINNVYSTADLFVFPSISEGFGRAPFEALLMGSVVICNDKVSIIGEFMDDDNIWKNYFDYPDWDIVFSEISQLNPYECVRSIKKVREMLSPKNHAKDFLKIINSSLK